MKRFFLYPVMIVFFLITGSIAVYAESNEQVDEKDEPLHVQLLGINDFHGQLNVTRSVNEKKAGGASVLATYLKNRESEVKNTILVHAGDAVGASAPISSLLQDEPTIEVLNTLGFDVGTSGNHEFDEGTEEMLRLIHGGYHEKTGEFRGADFPYTLANVVDKRTGEAILPPYVIKKVEGVPIGFIGVVTTRTPEMVNPAGVENVEFLDETTAINDAVSKLQQESVEAIIVLAHVPSFSSLDGTRTEGDLVDIAEKVDDEVDVLFGGHNHAYTNAIVDGKLIVQAHAFGTAFSDVDVWIDPETQDIIKKKAEIVMTYHSGVEPDREMDSMVKTYEKIGQPLLNQRVGRAASRISNRRDKSGESTLGRLIADAQRVVMGADFAFVNHGGIRNDLPKGEITKADLYNIQPFQDHLVKMTFSGNQIKQVLEQQWCKDGKKILQVSGLIYTFSEDGPIGEKVLALTKADGTPLKADERYTVTVNGYLAGGGDGFSMFLKGTDKRDGPIDVDALAAYIEQQKQPIRPPQDDRISIK